MNEAVVAAVRELDLRRLRGMIDADIGLLSQVLSERLVWIHGSGHAQDKAAFLQSITSASTIYRSLERKEDGCIAAPGVVIFTGTVDIAAVIGGTEHMLKNRFTNVWMKEEETWRMASWQSTPVRE